MKFSDLYHGKFLKTILAPIPKCCFNPTQLKVYEITRYMTNAPKCFVWASTING